jgi:hypothetical protein
MDGSCPHELAEVRATAAALVGEPRFGQLLRELRRCAESEADAMRRWPGQQRNMHVLLPSEVSVQLVTLLTVLARETPPPQGSFLDVLS